MSNENNNNGTTTLVVDDEGDDGNDNNDAKNMIQQLNALDHEFCMLQEKDIFLRTSVLRTLQKEEIQLRQALDEYAANNNPRSKMKSKNKEKVEAVARLENILFLADDDSSSSCNSGDD